MGPRFWHDAKHTLLEARPKHLLSWEYELVANTAVVATVTLTWRRETGLITCGAAAYEAHRAPGGRSGYVLTAMPREVATAQLTYFFRRRARITWNERRLELRPLRVLSRSFGLFEAGAMLGTVRPRRPLARRAVVDLPEELPLEVRAFAFWLVLVFWRRALAGAS